MAIRMEEMQRRPIYAIILIGILAVAMGMFVAIQAAPLAMATSTNTLTANVNVQGVCWAAALPNPQTFGLVFPSTVQVTNLQVTDNNVGGNMASYLWIKGGDWAGPGTNVITVGNTLYNAVTQSSYIGNVLTTVTTNTNIFLPSPTIAAPTTSNYIYFGLNIPAGTANGVYTQTVTFNNLCSTAFSNTLTLTANVQATCYTSVSPSAITFGNMYPGTTYNTNVVVTDNDVGGNVGVGDVRPGQCELGVRRQQHRRFEHSLQRGQPERVSGQRAVEHVREHEHIHRHANTGHPLRIE